MTFEQSVTYGHSFIHRLDPRVRVVAAMACSVCIALLRYREVACVGLAVAVFCLALSRPSLRFALRRLAAVNIFLLFLWLIVPLTAGGEAVLRLGSLEISQPGLALVTLVTLKANALALLFIALVCSMSPATLGQALDRLRCPPKLVVLLLFSWRYLGAAVNEWHRLAVAARLRGFVPRTGLHAYRTFGILLGMTFVCSFERSERVYDAMLLRGFSGRFPSFAPFCIRARDAVFAAVALAVLAGLILCDVNAGQAHV